MDLKGFTINIKTFGISKKDHITVTHTASGISMDNSDITILSRYKVIKMLQELILEQLEDK